jgi:hypothetical protein
VEDDTDQRNALFLPDRMAEHVAVARRDAETYISWRGFEPHASRIRCGVSARIVRSQEKAIFTEAIQFGFPRAD